MESDPDALKLLLESKDKEIVRLKLKLAETLDELNRLRRLQPNQVSYMKPPKS